MKQTREGALTQALLAFLALCPPGALATDPSKNDFAWEAEWIGPTEPSQPNSWFAFRKQFALDSKPTQATARIACDSKYWLWVNDELAVFEGGLKRGPNRHDSYYDAVDFSSFLREGENTVAILLWHFGKHGFSHNDSGQAGLVFQADLDGELLQSDNSWKMIPHPAFGDTDEPRPNYRLPEGNIRFDARLDPVGWQSSDFNDSEWENAASLGRAGDPPWGDLVLRPFPQWKDSGLQPYESIETEKLQDGTTRIVAKLPYNAQATPFLELDAPEGRVIDIRSDHYYGGGAPNVRAEYITKAGRQSWEALGWMNGHSIVYTLPKDVALLSARYRETGYPAERVGSFRCDDPMLNELWRKAYRTLYVNMRDTFFDCPDRERAQWIGDGIIEFHQVYYALDALHGPKLVRKAIREIADWQRPDGVLYSPVPSGWPHDPLARSDSRTGTWNMELPMQLLAYCSESSLWTYYLYTADEETLAHVYPAVRDYLNLWTLDANGLVRHRSGDWDWPDWGDNHDVMPLENAWYYSALSSAANIAELIGETADLPWYSERMASIRSSYNDRYWQGGSYRDPLYTGSTDDRANAMAIVARLADESQFPALREVLQTQRHSSPYMEKFVLEALCLMGDAEGAMRRMKERWKPQIESELTTLWEGWGLGDEGYGGGTANHAWAGGALTILSQYIAGIEPSEPGWKAFAVSPRPAGLREIDASVPTPLGTIALSLRETESEGVLKLEIPDGAQATVSLPPAWIAQAESLAVDGRAVPLADRLSLEAGTRRVAVAFAKTASQ